MIKKIITVLLISFIFSCGQKQETKEILFVCTHGAARSPIGAAYFNAIAAQQNLNYRAVFRGTAPDSVLTKETIAGLKKDGFDTAGWKPKKVSEDDIVKANTIITFDCQLPSQSKSKEIQWNGTPSVSKDYDTARDVIKSYVLTFVKTLPKN